jgi:uncharacterized protein
MISIAVLRVSTQKKEQILCAFLRQGGYLSAVDTLVINLAELPDEGQEFVGELPGALFDLSDKDVQPLSPLSYRLRAQRFENELLLMGRLEAAFEFTCVRTLVPFKKTITLENAAVSLEINESTEIDPSEDLREEVLLQFPAYPRCDEADDPLPCEIDPRYLAVDNGAGADVENPPAPQGDSRWGALDALEDASNQSDQES